MRIVKRLATSILVSALLVGGLAGCKEETAGERLDKAVDGAKKAAEDMKK